VNAIAVPGADVVADLELDRLVVVEPAVDAE